MVAKFLTVTTALGAKFRQIVVLCGSLACDRGALGQTAQMAQGKSGPVCIKCRKPSKPETHR
jgi:hypothetical protein